MTNNQRSANEHRQQAAHRMARAGMGNEVFG